MLPQNVLRSLVSRNGARRVTLRQLSSSAITGSRSLSAMPSLIESGDVVDLECSSAATMQGPARRARNVRSAMKEVGIQPNYHAETRLFEASADSEESASPSQLCYFGNKAIPIVSELHIVTPEDDTPRGIWPVFRMMDENGRFRESPWTSFPPMKEGDLGALRTHVMQHHPFLGSEFSRNPLLQPADNDYPDLATKNTLLRAHRQIVRLREMDSILQSAQRQGRISFYMTSRGEEAIHIGAAAALTLNDIVLAQYREAGVLMWRGFTLEQFTNQCFSNDLDLGKGRQMPIHYGSRALNYLTISSPLGTQLTQAVGVAYRLKLQKKPNIAICFFGDGSSSSIDFHSACNFAATLKVPIIFFCRNNGFAISTPVDEQYAGDGIVSRAPGYGMAGIRVDGNDIFAVSAVVKAAKEYVLANSAPIMIEAMTYRQGSHSTSDDSTLYRNVMDVEKIAEFADPVKRLEAFLTQIGWVDSDSLAAARDEEKKAVLNAVMTAQQRPSPPLKFLFQDVYHQVPNHLREEEEGLRRHIAKYPDNYETST